MLQDSVKVNEAYRYFNYVLSCVGRVSVRDFHSEGSAVYCRVNERTKCSLQQGFEAFIGYDADL